MDLGALCSLKAFIKYCCDEELLHQNPMSRVPTPKAPKTLPRYLTIDEVRRILGTATAEADLPGVWLVSSTFLRTGRCLGFARNQAGDHAHHHHDEQEPDPHGDHQGSEQR